ncbi:hypothetical protein DTO013E5_3392 [Penicillium roqueforti]|uniref:Protein kinase-like domain n=1 Tax=Penicillium roqueforti (strain FM164) TaxID=1365484 RepID=W6QYQ5_PENRF|nr:uncharacterized protein LCP9604111_4084 [Penicillium roqueforti]CDM34682.1 Protein kinase-like domain [Penicillium roqueforti FM164]KAF9249984.1 hypothetical protein LCP9604111_4084 [Penicillium roqueforti]KAI2678213.1 hypothetical protein CBS147355_5214 [Penicillium roqueforti]KAI2681183.1 hypothetical protein LCP963914a_6693 [Penicillium roqueforti]KAI2707832.1 hypothetical protein CBS147354_9456 [Penicillium roqueforti]
MASNSFSDVNYRILELEEKLRQAEEGRRQAEDEARKEKERTRPTTFMELLRSCHSLLSLPLRVGEISVSTTGQIPAPTGKFCPTRLELWVDCPAQQQALYSAVCGYLQSEDSLRAFPSLHQIEGYQERLTSKPIDSEKGIEHYEQYAVEYPVNDIITVLSKLPLAREEFGLGDGIEFSSHINALNAEAVGADTSQPSSIPNPKPDQFWIRRIDGNTQSILTTVEYKPPHKLSVETLRLGLRPMNLWEKIVYTNTIPNDVDGKARYNAERLACSAIVQEYHVMIQKGLEYSYVTNGIARVLLRVPYDNPSTLYYFFCDPNRKSEPNFQFPNTSIAHVLCLCLMAFRSPVRDQIWRSNARSVLRTWKTNFDHTLSEIPKEELQQIPRSCESSFHSEVTDPDSSTDYHPSPQSGSSPQSNAPTEEGRQSSTSSQPAGCAPTDDRHRAESPNSSGSDTNQERRKRRISQVTSSPSTRQEPRNDRRGQSYRHDAQFCTQRCLLGLQTGGTLDEHCPNVSLHRQSPDDHKHPINAGDLVRLLKIQLGENRDKDCTPFGTCGSYGAPFKLTCTAYGYTVVGKGTTSGLWKEVSREAEIYQILRKVQGSAVPVFLGTIDLLVDYYHDAGDISHMLIMGWGGENIVHMEMTSLLRREIHRSKREIRKLRVTHGDLRDPNILWNPELNRILIIDFHKSKLDPRPLSKQSGPMKRKSDQTELSDGKDGKDGKRLHMICE